MRISDWSSDVCSSDLRPPAVGLAARARRCAGLGLAAGRCARERGSGSQPGHGLSGSAAAAARQPAARDAALFLQMRDPRVEQAEEHTSELQSLMRISYAVFCLNTQTIPEIWQNDQAHEPTP